MQALQRAPCCAVIGTCLPRHAYPTQAWRVLRLACVGHGGPLHSVGGMAARAARSAATCSSATQRPTLQCGQHAISMAATRRMKACASSHACGFALGMLNSCRAKRQPHGLGRRCQQPVVADAHEAQPEGSTAFVAEEGWSSQSPRSMRAHARIGQGTPSITSPLRLAATAAAIQFNMVWPALKSSMCHNITGSGRWGALRSEVKEESRVSSGSGDIRAAERPAGLISRHLRSSTLKSSNAGSMRGLRASTGQPRAGPGRH
jgi:hypothetical protein